MLTFSFSVVFHDAGLSFSVYEGEGDAAAGVVDVDDRGLYALAELQDFADGGYALAAQLGDMYQAVFVDTQIDEGAECGDVVDDAGQLHSLMELLETLHSRHE